MEKITPDNEQETVELDLENKFRGKILQEANNTIEGIANAFSVKIIEIATLLLLFITAKLILRFVTILADLIAKIPVLKQVNKLGGTIYGILKGIIIVYVILAIVYLISPVLQGKINETIDKTVVTKTMYYNNILLNIIF